MDCDIEEVGLHCNGMNDAGDRVNTIQNEIMTTEKELSLFIESTERKKLDLRLKYRKRIDYANLYYNAKSDLTECEIKVQEAKEAHQSACQKLAKLRENIFSDLSPEASQNMRALRDNVSQAQTNLYDQERRRSSQLSEVNRIYKKHKKSIDMTKDYFEAKNHANDELHRLREKQKNLKQELSNWREIYAEHMARLQEISESIHLERSAKAMADQRLLTSENEHVLNSIGPSIDVDNESEDIWVDSIPDDVSEADDDARSIYSLTDSLNSSNNARLLRPFSHVDSRSCGSPVRNIGDRASLRSNSPYRRSVSDQSQSSPSKSQKGCITAHESAVSWHPLG